MTGGTRLGDSGTRGCRRQGDMRLDDRERRSLEGRLTGGFRGQEDMKPDDRGT